MLKKHIHYIESDSSLLEKYANDYEEPWIGYSNTILNYNKFEFYTWLIGSGGAYINTGFILPENCVIRVHIMGQAGSNHAILGANDGSNSLYIKHANSSGSFRVEWKYDQNAGYQKILDKYTIHQQKLSYGLHQQKVEMVILLR